MMQVQLMSYGALTDITGSEVFELEIPQQALTVAEMKLHLLARYPALEGKTFRMAVNERFVGDDFEVLSGVKIALMPPFSGGDGWDLRWIYNEFFMNFIALHLNYHI